MIYFGLREYSLPLGSYICLCFCFSVCGRYLPISYSGCLSALLLPREGTAGSMVCQCQSHWIRASVYSSSCCEVCKYEKVYPRVQNASKWQYCVGFSFSTAHHTFPQALQQGSQQKAAVIEMTGPTQKSFLRKELWLYSWLLLFLA